MSLGRPGPGLSDFGGLAGLPDNSSVQFQYKSLEDFDPAKPSLQVSKEEALLIANAKAQGGDGKAIFAKVWPQILQGRVSTFLSGNGSASYDVGAFFSGKPSGDRTRGRKVGGNLGLSSLFLLGFRAWRWKLR